VTDGNGQAEDLRNKGLQLLFEDAAAGRIGATAIRLKQQMRSRWEALRQFMLTPMGQIIHRKQHAILYQRIITLDDCVVDQPS